MSIEVIRQFGPQGDDCSYTLVEFGFGDVKIRRFRDTPESVGFSFSNGQPEPVGSITFDAVAPPSDPPLVRLLFLNKAVARLVLEGMLATMEAEWNTIHPDLRADPRFTINESPGGDGKYGRISSTKKQFHPGEPVFLIRATDIRAVQAIQDYAYRCETIGCDHDHVQAIYAHAERVSQWQEANPTLVKKPD